MSTETFIISKLFPKQDVVYPTTIAKLLLSTVSINDFLKLSLDMQNLNTSYFNDFCEDFKNNKIDSLPSDSKKDKLLYSICEAQSFIKMSYNTTFDAGDQYTHAYLSERMIIFYNTNTNLMIAFTYFPLHNLKTSVIAKCGISDILVREIKSYVFDNVSPEKFEELVSSKVVSEMAHEDILKPVLTTRYSRNYDEILKLVKFGSNMYQWELFQRNHFNTSSDVCLN